jgi:cryptochrome
VGLSWLCIFEAGRLALKACPILQDMPAKYIWEPWKAPMKVQEDAKCIIGKDYPAPIVDHAVVSKRCIARMKGAYDAEKAGQNSSAPGPAPKRKQASSAEDSAQKKTKLAR